MSTDERYEALSRLLSGEITGPEAESLHAEISADPQLASVWEAMCALPEGLADLPDVAPPPELDEAVLQATEPVSIEVAAPRGRPWLAAMGWLAAAAVALFVFWPASEPAQIFLAEGSQWVDGHALVYAGDQVVEVDGAARISVEPPRRDLRVVGVQTEDAMQRRDVLVGALAGAVVTVAVYEGTARMWPADSDGEQVVEIAEGAAKTVGISKTPQGIQLERGTAPQGETPEQTIARLTEERDALAQELEESRFEGAIARGQLAAHQGEAIEWDDSIPMEHRPEAVEAGIDSFLEEHPEVELADLDCSEFPCIATFTPIPGSDVDSMAIARQLPKDYAGSLFGEGSAVMASVMAHEGEDGGMTELVSIAAVPEDRKDGDWATRAQYRTEAIADTVMDYAPDTEDVAIDTP